MIKRTLIAGLIIISFLAASMNFAIAVYSETFNDDPGDVIDFESGEIASGKENLDIVKLICSRDYRRVTLKLTVDDDGEIENKGDILIWRLTYDEDFAEDYFESIGMTDLEDQTEYIMELLLQDWTMYSFEIYTSGTADEYDNIYQVIYINNEILILDIEENVISGGEKSVSGNTLTVSFDILTSKENISEIDAVSYEYSSDDENEYVYVDEVYGECNDPLVGSGDNNGGDDEGGSGSGFTVFVVMIVILVVAVVAVVVYFIRR